MTPVLKSQRVSYIGVDYSDLDNFITKVYGHPFECVSDQEWSNDSKYTLYVKKEEKEYDWDKSKLWEFVEEGKYHYSLQIILADLCKRGLLEPGEYLVSVCW